MWRKRGGQVNGRQKQHQLLLFLVLADTGNSLTLHTGLHNTLHTHTHTVFS
ncbi:Uncharacterized protein APZ42_021556 [Daphnia magna]|uniref:Uncharacterized protein n=1 Tax=Daphnia magna TaxID=35525 RepID=A0A162CA64_9CRUS|nr:Uncharacterized protein APZ42_021556 [Daphnia magna]